MKRYLFNDGWNFINGSTSSLAALMGAAAKPVPVTLPHDALIDLVRRMLTEDIRLTCPHGRPLMIELTRTDLEKRFKRIQN